MTDQFALYRFYGSDDALLYVGITSNPEQRFSDHRRGKPWWHQVTTIKIERHGSYVELMHAEIIAIQAEDPRYNISYSNTPPPELIKVRNSSQARSATSPDANTFGTEHRPLDTDNRPVLIRQTLPCPKCYGIAHREAEPDGDRQATGGVECSICGETWTYEEWQQANGIRP